MRHQSASRNSVIELKVYCSLLLIYVLDLYWSKSFIGLQNTVLIALIYFKKVLTPSMLAGLTVCTYQLRISKPTLFLEPITFLTLRL